MDSVFWVGIFVGAILSFAASIGANLANKRVQDFVEKRRYKIGLKRKSKEEKTFRLVRDLKSGKYSQSYYFSIMSSHKLFNYIAAAWLSGVAILAMIGLRLIGKIGPGVSYSELSFDALTDLLPIPAGLFGAAFSATYAVINSFRMDEVGRKLNSYEAYRRKLELNYPDFDFGAEETEFTSE